MRNFKTRYVTETDKSELQVSTDGLSKRRYSSLAKGKETFTITQ